MSLLTFFTRSLSSFLLIIVERLEEREGESEKRPAAKEPIGIQKSKVRHDALTAACTVVIVIVLWRDVCLPVMKLKRMVYIS